MVPLFGGTEVLVSSWLYALYIIVFLLLFLSLGRRVVRAHSLRVEELGAALPHDFETADLWLVKVNFRRYFYQVLVPRDENVGQ